MQFYFYVFFIFQKTSVVHTSARRRFVFSIFVFCISDRIMYFGSYFNNIIISIISKRAYYLLFKLNGLYLFWALESDQDWVDFSIGRIYVSVGASPDYLSRLFGACFDWVVPYLEHLQPNLKFSNFEVFVILTQFQILKFWSFE